MKNKDSCKFIEFFKVRKNEENPLVATKFRSSQEEQFLSRLGKSTEFKHHIILYNTPSCQVLEKYGEIILEEYGHLDENLIHKAVGIVGRDKEGEKVFDRTLSGRTLIPQIYEKGMGTGK